jgi:hypothetical protein
VISVRFRLPVVCVLASAVALGVASAARADRPGWLPPGTPRISGTAQVGATLTGDVGSISCQPGCTFAGGEWLSCSGASAGGADRPPGEQDDPEQRAAGCLVRWPFPALRTYTLGPEDEGRYIQYHVIAENVDCGEEECTPGEAHGYSPTVGPIAAAPEPRAVLPAVAEPVTISGDAEDMQTLAVRPGSWSGTGPISFSYQWLRCAKTLESCKAIEGAVATTYRIVRADVGARLTAAVTGTNRAGAIAARARLTRFVVAARPRPGRDVLRIGELRHADRLVVRSVEGPRLVQARSGVLLRITVADRRGFLIDGAAVEASGERSAVVRVKTSTGARGVAYVLIRLRTLAAPRVVVRITASKPGDRALTASTRVALRVLR